MQRTGSCALQIYSKWMRQIVKLIDPLYYLQVVFNQTSELISLDDVQRQIREQHDEQFGQFAVDRRVADKEDMQERLA